MKWKAMGITFLVPIPVLALLVGALMTPATSETVSYSYDARGRLVEVSRASGPSSGVENAYKHDNAHNIKRKTVTGG